MYVKNDKCIYMRFWCSRANSYPLWAKYKGRLLSVGNTFAQYQKGRSWYMDINSSCNVISTYRSRHQIYDEIKEQARANN